MASAFVTRPFEKKKDSAGSPWEPADSWTHAPGRLALDDGSRRRLREGIKVGVRMAMESAISPVSTISGRVQQDGP